MILSERMSHDARQNESYWNIELGKLFQTLEYTLNLSVLVSIEILPILTLIVGT